MPDASASHVAGTVLIITKDLHPPAKASQLLNLATTAPLVAAAKNAWLLCLEANKHRLRPKLERLCSTVAAKFGSALSIAAKNTALQAIQPHISANPSRPGVNWQSIALQLASTPFSPITPYTALHNVVDAATFRQGIRFLWHPTSFHSATNLRQLQGKVKQLLPLVPESGNFDWFLAGLSAPLAAMMTVVTSTPPPPPPGPSPPNHGLGPSTHERDHTTGAG